MEKITIYRIYFPEPNKCYIGQTYYIKKRMMEHLTCSKGYPINKAFNKYDNYDLSVLHICNSREEANRLEVDEIRNFDSVAPGGYNLTTGGEVRKEYSEETKAKIRSAHIGAKHTEECKRKMSAAKTGSLNHFYGRKHTEATKQKIREIKTGHKHSKETVAKIRINSSGRNNGMFGRKHTEESNRKNRISNLKYLFISKLATLGKLESELLSKGVDVEQFVAKWQEIVNGYKSTGN